VLIGGEFEYDSYRAGIDIDLEVCDGKGGEGREQERRIGGLNVLVDIWRGLLED